MNLTRLINVASICVLASALSATCLAQSETETVASDWRQLRGTKGTGTAPASAKPAIDIDLGSQIAWTTDIPGTGWSSPVYDGDLVWMTTSTIPEDGQAQSRRSPPAKIELRAIAVNKNDGKLTHNILLKTVDKPRPINPLNSYASPTPAISGGKVVCHFGSYGTWCLDAESGKPIWETQYKIEHAVGPGSSPVIFEGRVILVCDGTDQQFVAAVGLDDGKEIWNTDRPPIRNPDGDYRKSYCTPILIEIAGRKQVVVTGAQWINGYDLETGKENWRADHGSGFSVTPMPVYDSGLVVFATGFMRSKFVAVDPTGKGDVTESHVKWTAKGAPTMPSFLVNDGKVYSMSEKGILVCLDVKTGEILNRSRIGKNYSSSPLLANGHLYCCDREGMMTVIKCSTDLSVVSKTQFEDGVMASPILIGDDLLIRTKKQLMRIKK